MKKILKKSLTIVFIISLTLYSLINYDIVATALYTLEDSIFEVNSSESIDNDIKMNLNINAIEYENFIIKLSSSEIIENLSIEEELDIETNSNDEISFEISKTVSNLSTISLNYKIPESLSVGSKITFVLEIVNMENEEDSIIITKEVTITQSNIEEDNNEKDDKIEDQNSSNQNNNEKSQNTVVKNSTQSNSQVKKVVYNGSDNNYLSKLVIDNYSLNKEFTKESSTYFVTVDNDVTKLTIKATAEDNNSIVKINGNDSLEVGVNKVLITVTAENGNTRNYRIYITRSSDK